MSALRRKRGPTHADAALAGMNAAKKGLIHIAGWGESEADRKIALAALEAARVAYTNGVLRAVD